LCEIYEEGNEENATLVPAFHGFSLLIQSAINSQAPALQSFLIHVVPFQALKGAQELIASNAPTTGPFKAS